MGIYVCHNVHKHLCHYCVERKLTLCGKKKCLYVLRGSEIIGGL